MLERAPLATTSARRAGDPARHQRDQEFVKRGAGMKHARRGGRGHICRSAARWATSNPLPFPGGRAPALAQSSGPTARQLHLTCLPWIATAGELKTKPTQHGASCARSAHPAHDALLCPCPHPPCRRAREDLPVHQHYWPSGGVISMWDVDTITTRCRACCTGQGPGRPDLRQAAPELTRPPTSSAAGRAGARDRAPAG